jgi:hypothetical protein
LHGTLVSRFFAGHGSHGFTKFDKPIGLDWRLIGTVFPNHAGVAVTSVLDDAEPGLV